MENDTTGEASEEKSLLREQIWREVDRFVTGPKPVQGRIPNFRGSKAAANKLVIEKEFWIGMWDISVASCFQPSTDALKLFK